jgi:pilus assembly protein CpaB
VRASTIIMIGFAVVFGVLAVFVAQTWLNNQAELRAKNLDAQKKTAPTRTIVVASRPLRFGAELSTTNLREVGWPEEALPAGSFSKMSEVTGARRIALTAIEPNEPVLNSKITGPGQRATLSAVIHEGMKAVTIRVNDVDGVGGFVLPGDHVDVVLTRQGGDKNSPSNDVVLQNTRVLAIDQLADERSEKPTVAKSVTLEVNTAGAQKLALASSVGSLSLMLRKAGEANAEYTRRITLNDIGAAPAPVVDRSPKDTTTVSVTRSAIKQDYRVPIEGGAARRAATSGEVEAAEQ